MFTRLRSVWHAGGRAKDPTHELPQRIKVAWLLNRLAPGTGPFQRGIRLNDQRFDVAFVSFYDSTEALAAKAQDIFPLPTCKRFIGLAARSRWDLVAWRRLWNTLRQEDPHIIQSAHTLTALLGFLFGRFSEIPVLCNFEGTLRTRYGILRRFAKALIVSLADVNICVSASVRESSAPWERLMHRRVQQVVINNGVSLEEIDRAEGSSRRWRSVLGGGDGQVLIGTAGDLKVEKDPLTLIRAASLVLASAPNTRLVLVGDGPLRKEAEVLARRLGLNDHVVFTGLVQRREVYEILHALSVVIMPSLVEGLSETIVQAMAAQKPVIASDIPPNRELVQDGVTGYLVPPQNPKALTKVILELLAKPELRRSMGLAARKVIEARLDIRHIIEQYESLYENLLCAQCQHQDNVPAGTGSSPIGHTGTGTRSANAEPRH